MNNEFNSDPTLNIPNALLGRSIPGGALWHSCFFLSESLVTLGMLKPSLPQNAQTAVFSGKHLFCENHTKGLVRVWSCSGLVRRAQW